MARTTPPPSHKKGCCSALDAGDARRVADRLDMPFYALDFEQDFARIMDYFVDEYAVGRTPNPCVVCNTWLKFGKLWSYGKQLGADFIATGHYAQITRDGGAIAPGPRYRTKTNRTSCSASTGNSCRICYFRSAACARTRSAPWPAKPTSASPTSPTASRSASCPTTITPISSRSAAPNWQPPATSSNRRQGARGP